ncbi:MAG: alpha-1,2-fucosyltransferase [Chitinophagaceae bacterium]|nr:MAG: alpha-1,2-fucosyltransferase [Chitinophagaceae bacterium]
MVISKIYGGLAGQMLQYAIGRHLSIKYNTHLLIDTYWYKKPGNPQFPRDFGLKRLNTQCIEIASYSWLWWQVRLSGRFNRFPGLPFKVIKEKDYSVFDPSMLELGANVLLDGYWNSYKYFEPVRSQLMKEFSPADLPDERNRECLNMIQSQNSVSIHFRRGDYALTSFHGILSRDYYEAAIAKITAEISNPYLFIFSDEPKWVIENMRFSFPYKIVDFNKDEKNYWDIELMKNCKHNIIANSGFSWWAGWLNENPEKIVIAPEKWINTDKTRIDNIPADWFLL